LAGLFTVADDFESGRDCSSWLLYTLSGAWDGATYGTIATVDQPRPDQCSRTGCILLQKSFVMKLSNEKGPEVEADVYNREAVCSDS